METLPPPSRQLSTSVVLPSKKIIPGFGGFCPTVREHYGITYSNATRSFYQQNRQDVLNTSHKPSQLSSTGPIEAPNVPPTVVNSSVVVKQNPSPVKPGEGLWTSPLPYTLHLTSARRDKMLEYDKYAQFHRQHYKDHTGLMTPVQGIRHARVKSAPPIAKIELLKFGSYPSQMDAHNLPPLTTSVSFIRQTSTIAKTQYVLPHRRGSARERSTRNSFFEKR